MLTISQLAAHAGVTVKAVRHYHAKGLLPEPERDHSGYRRYDAQAVVDLIKIRTLADAGVPLSRAQSLLAADDATFAAAVEEIDRRMQDEIAQRQRHREQLKTLAAGDSVALPPEALPYLDQLRQIGLPERVVEVERDSWIVIAAQHPEEMPGLMAIKTAQILKPEVIELYRDLADALDWSPDDPRLEGLADRIDALRQAGEQADGSIISGELAALLDSVFCTTAHYAHRLLRLLADRGWTGWTNAALVAA
jgi:DNA-binding transcriptional MerR regulator